jgi:DNA-binding response OmpR family regulator
MSDRSYHIMLVEDSASQAMKLTGILEAEGWRVTWASSAEEALAGLQEEQPDLLLLDYYLPGMRGDEVCRRVRMNIDGRSLPIVMLTAQEDNEIIGLDSGADDFIVKSANPEVLLLRLRTLLHKSRAERPILEKSARTSLRSARLLAIDDSTSFLERLRPELEEEGYQLETTTQPRESIDRIGDGNFDGVIIDLVMPEMDGLEVCRRINDMRRQLDTPLVTIVLTGTETTENLSRALEAGADDFVGKSSDFSVLKGRIRALLRRKFFAEENNRILTELRQKELEAVRERTAKEAAEARVALVEQLQERTEELHRSQEELKKASAAKDQFLAILSHELRTPLTPILAVVSERREDPNLPEDVRDDLEMIRRNIELEARLIDDLLDLTRISQGKLEIRGDEVDCRDIVEHVVAMCRVADTPQAVIIEDLRAERTSVQGDAMRLTQVVWNLLRNAIKFTPPDGRITVSLWNEADDELGDQLSIQIQDTGIGIEPQNLDRIFDAFEQGSRQVTRQFGGLGLGLAISKALVTLHGGRITATSAGRGLGATFRVDLPAIPVTVAAAGLILPDCLPTPAPETPKKPAAAAAPAADAPPLRILLVEDHEDTRAIMKRLLKVRGYEVAEADSVAAAGRLAREQPPFDLLISDLGLPDGSGVDAYNEVNAIHPVRAIALSGYGMEDDVRRSLQHGFSVHLTKPVDFTQLNAEINAMFGGQEG